MHLLCSKMEMLFYASVGQQEGLLVTEGTDFKYSITEAHILAKAATVQ